VGLLPRTPLLMCDPFVVANLRIEFKCHVQYPVFYLDICWGKCSWGWLFLLVKIQQRPDMMFTAFKSGESGAIHPY